MKNIIFTILTLFIGINVAFCQRQVLTVKEIEKKHLHLIDSLAKENKLNWLSYSIENPYRDIYIDLKKDNQNIISEKRSIILKLILIGLDTVSSHINWDNEKNKRTLFISDYPEVIDETDSIRTVYANMPPEYLKNAVHKRLYIEQLARKEKEIEYRNYQSRLIDAYNTAYEYFGKSLQKYYIKTEIDKVEISNIINRYGKDKEALLKFINDKN